MSAGPPHHEPAEIAVIPTALRRSLIADAVIDGLLGLVLFIAPEPVLRAFGWHAVDPIATRLLASALFGMSAQTWLGRNGDVAEIRAGLNLKVVWTGTATLGLAIAVASGALLLVDVALIAFGVFFVQWIYWRRKLRSSSRG